MKKLLLIALLLLPISIQAGPKAQLVRLTHKLTFTSLVEKPVHPFVIQRSAVRRFMNKVERVNSQTCWPSSTFDEQAASMLDDTIENLPQLGRLMKLLDYMKANLTDLQVVYFGDEPEWDIHVFGRDSQGNIIGFHFIEVV